MSALTIIRCRQGLTLVETLVALVLLSGVATATAALLRSVSDVHSIIAPELLWATQAERAMMCIADDLLVRDRIESREPVTEADGMLTIVSRSATDETLASPVMIRYRFDPISGHLSREIQRLDEREQQIGLPEVRVILGIVEALSIEPIEREVEGQRRAQEVPPIAYRIEIRSGDVTISRVVRP